MHKDLIIISNNSSYPIIYQTVLSTYFIDFVLYSSSYSYSIPLFDRIKLKRVELKIRHENPCIDNKSVLNIYDLLY